MRIIYLLIILLLALPIYGQKKIAGDSLLKNERTMDRPIIAHDGQLRITTSYAFATLSSRFDQDGEKIKLSDLGNIGVSHDFRLGLEYGFFEIFQFMVSVSYQASNQREQPVLVFTIPEVVNINEVSRYTGMKDLFLGTKVLIPGTGRALDIAFLGGVTIPTASNEPDEPEHTAESFTDNGNPPRINTEINYLYNENLGLGVTTAILGGHVKFRFQDFAISGSFNYRFPTSESESVFWSHRLVDTNEFEYLSQTYAYLPADEYVGQLLMEYQLYPWINLFLDLEYYGTKGGWSEETGKKVAFRDQNLGLVNPGVEILLTPKFWLRQRVIIGVLGESSFSPAGIESGLIYNLFPF